MLKEIGIKKLWDKNGDFNDLSDKTGLYVDQIIHKAKIIVKETGSGVSEFKDVGEARHGESITLKFNRPFIFFIYSVRTKTIVSIGVIREAP